MDTYMHKYLHTHDVYILCTCIDTSIYMYRNGLRIPTHPFASIAAYRLRRVNSLACIYSYICISACLRLWMYVSACVRINLFMYTHLITFCKHRYMHIISCKKNHRHRLAQLNIPTPHARNFCRPTFSRPKPGSRPLDTKPNKSPARDWSSVLGPNQSSSTKNLRPEKRTKASGCIKGGRDVLSTVP